MFEHILVHQLGMHFNISIYSKSKTKIENFRVALGTGKIHAKLVSTQFGVMEIPNRRR